MDGLARTATALQDPAAREQTPWAPTLRIPAPGMRIRAACGPGEPVAGAPSGRAAAAPARSAAPALRRRPSVPAA